MKLQQLRYLVEVAKQGLNVSEAAEKLHTSQPGISKQIRLLEDELGIQVFIRNGKRVVAVSEPGKEVLRIAERILREAQNLKRVGDEFSREAEGSLTVATTHTQARYALPDTIAEFVRRYPKVRLSIKQGSPTQICEMVVAGEADLAVATEGIALYKDLAMLPCYEWNRSIVVPVGHPLLDLERTITLADIASYPIVTYDFAFAGRSKINKAFSDAGLTPNVVLTAIDTDVIKTYVTLGLGIGIIATMSYEAERDTKLRAIDASHLFDSSTTKIGLRKDAYLRGFAYTFIELFAPHLTRKAVEAALLAHEPDDDE
ncbi:HTH-type transcriptional regulator CysB [Crenobacter sp. SG2303]|uniref:HTH-type transcriptional regulator CysB n=1 Tax=Crenobacter oryzisoli TaxID=3056844 RepID=A0ABT7XHW1_9NEIS|nr:MULTISPECIES: HTH-type transcriptional regulator CysB [unclassified Crenobacter]MDN0073367.1 HTH-type transcriptional regulator CysB [Crenobacter sp. SG2303]MDN0084453.1 HTH-type transcriptional regulator CysB [Crenobacter sp. SG2305]